MTGYRCLGPISALCLLLGGACDKSDSGESMPAAKSWSAPAPVASQTGAASGRSAVGGDPHAGMNMGGDPHAGMDMGGDPHAGMDMGGDPAMAAMSPPDPDQPIDKSKFLRGTLDGTAETRPLIKPGAIVYIAVRPIDKKTGQVSGGPIAVERIDVTKLPVGFELTQAHAMVAGTSFAGDVVIDARVDGDGEARTKEPGDIVGSVKAAIPAKGLQLELDTVLR